MSRRAALYLRISLDRTGEGLAVDRQREDARALAAARRWTTVAEHVDNDTSAAGRVRRPGFDALLEDVTVGRADTIIAWSMDRLSRNRRDSLRLIETCQPRGTLIALVRGSDLDLSSAAGRFVADMMASVARHEIEVKSERHRRQIEQAAKAGRPAPGRRAFGWRPGGLEPDPGEAETVKGMYRRLLTGATLNEIADWAGGSGPTSQGHRWSANTVRAVLLNPRHAGLRGMRPLTDENTGARARVYDVVAPGQWPALVDEPTWRAAQAVLTDPARPHLGRPGGSTPRRLLTGVLLCPCGAAMIGGRPAGTPARTYPTYACSTRPEARRRTGATGHAIRAAAPLDAYVTSAVLARLRRPDAAGLLHPDDDAPAVEELHGEALVLRTRLTRLAVDLADGVLDRDQVRIAGDRLRARLAEVQELIAAAGEVDVLGPLVDADGDAAAWALWDGYPVSTRRQIITRMMRVQVLPARRGRPPGGRFDPTSVRVEWLR